MTARWWWGWATGACWVVAFLLAVVPVVVDTERCGLPVADAIDAQHTDLGCVEDARDRVGVLAAWLVVTGGVSTAFLAACVTGRREE